MIICSNSDCNNEVQQTHIPYYYDGKPYCEEHYSELIWNDLRVEFNNWDESELPPERFKYLLGRISDEEKWMVEGESFLSKNRILTRAYNFIKTDSGCEFEITRHLNSWEGLGKKENIVERWEADLNNKTLTVLSKRKFRKGDLDL